MYRYAVFGWDAKDKDEADLARRLVGRLKATGGAWQSVIERPGLHVLHALHPRGACDAYVLGRDDGVVLGQLFRTADGAAGAVPKASLGDEEAARIVHSKGRHLVDNYWGHYVAVIRAPDDDVTCLLRDPTGGLQCFMARTAGIDVVLSDIEDYARLRMTPFTVDWEHLAAFFHDNRLVSRTTGFKEVKQLHAGECTSIGDDKQRTYRFYWDPVALCEAPAIDDADEARQALRTAITDCVGAWASNYGSIVHELSGGLDSSIVASCLADTATRPDVLCFHYFTEMSEGDERPYARQAARNSGFELLESEARTGDRTLESLISTSRRATPSALGLTPEPELLKQRLVGERRAGAVFSGQGGDQIFQELRSNRIAAEYAYRHGLRPSLLRIVSETSRLTGNSVWSVSAAVVKHGVLKRSHDPYAHHLDTPAMLSNAARTSWDPDDYVHPWIKRAGGLPASKTEHIFNVVDCQPFYWMPCSYAEQIHPLISQPIIECSLKIPTYVLVRGGTPRGLVREAFEADVPRSVTERRRKGDTTSYFNRLLVQNAGYLRELLLDGALVQEGFLDRPRLETMLSDRALMIGDARRDIMNGVMTEAWLNNWADERQQTAA